MPPPSHPSVLRDPSALPVPSRAWWWWPIETAAMLGAFLYWGVAGLLITLFSPLVRLLLPRERAERFGRSLLHRAFRVFVHYLRVTGLVQADLDSLRPLRELREPVIIAPNHTTMWDAVFVIACLPQPICIMKQGILGNPFLGGGARLAGYISNGNSSRLIRDAADALSRGGQLLLFPEGTRTRHDVRWINPLKGGCALVARRADVPVIPVFIRSNTRFLEKGWPLWKRPEFPIRISIELGSPMRAGEGESAHQFTTRLQETYEDKLSRAHKLRRQVD